MCGTTILMLMDPLIYYLMICSLYLCLPLGISQWQTVQDAKCHKCVVCLHCPSGTTSNEFFHGQTKLLKNPNNVFVPFCLVTALITFRKNVNFATLKRLWLVLMVSQACDWHMTFKCVGVILHIPKNVRKIA